MDKVTMSVQGNGNADGNQPEQSVCTDQRSGFSNRPCRQAGYWFLFPNLRCGYRQEPRRNDMSENKRGRRSTECMRNFRNS